MINRSQGLVLGFFVCVLIALSAILVLDPAIYSRQLPGPYANSALVGAGFLAALVVLLGLLGVGILRRWRWTFWLIVVAFVAGVLRVPGSVLELVGVLPRTGPDWYVVLQGGIGVIQCAIAIALLAGYRKNGVWGAF